MLFQIADEVSTSFIQDDATAVANLLPRPGNLTERVLLISDIHANWVALESVLQHAAGTYDTIWFLGDVVGYGPHPVRCTQFIHDHLAPNHWRAGNHDLGVVGRLNEDFGREAHYTLVHHKTLLEENKSLWEWFDQTVHPEKCGPWLKAENSGQQLLTHANLDNDMGANGYLFPNDPELMGRNFLALHDHVSTTNPTAWLLAGHTHIPCLFSVEATETSITRLRARSIHWGEAISIHYGHHYINPGSVGQPRDGNPDASYVLLDVVAHTATWHRVPYDIESVVVQLKRMDLDISHMPRDDARSARDTLIGMLRYGGSPRTEARMYPVYRKETHGLVVG